MYEEDIVKKHMLLYNEADRSKKWMTMVRLFDIVRLIDEERISRMENNCDNQDPIDPCPCYSILEEK